MAMLEGRWEASATGAGPGGICVQLFQPLCPTVDAE